MIFSLNSAIIKSRHGLLIYFDNVMPTTSTIVELKVVFCEEGYNKIQNRDEGKKERK
jgi:hypothetical protein